MRFSPRTTVAAFAAVAALSGGALALGGPASADTASDGATPARFVQVQDTTPAPDTAPDTAPDSQRGWDCPEDGQRGTTNGTTEAPVTAPVTTEL